MHWVVYHLNYETYFYPIALFQKGVHLHRFDPKYIWGLLFV